jgi:hypothetical protein
MTYVGVFIINTFRIVFIDLRSFHFYVIFIKDRTALGQDVTRPGNLLKVLQKRFLFEFLDQVGVEQQVILKFQAKGVYNSSKTFCGGSKKKDSSCVFELSI